MKLSPKALAIAAVLVSSAVLFFGWTKYYDFLNRGRRPPESHLILNTIEKKGVPPISSQTIDGRAITLEEFKGKIVILNFWASWCEPCVAEFPSLQNLIRHFKGEIVMLALSGDYEEPDIRTFLKAFNVVEKDIHVIWDRDQAIAKSYGTFKLPESYIIDREGRLIRKISGVDKWDTPEALEFFQSLVSENASQPVE